MAATGSGTASTLEESGGRGGGVGVNMDGGSQVCTEESGSGTLTLGGGKEVKEGLSPPPSLPGSLAEALEVIQRMGVENKRLKERLDNFVGEYPDFEWKRKLFLELKEEERVTKELMTELNSRIDHMNQKMKGKEDEISSLTKRIDKLKWRGLGPLTDDLDACVETGGKPAAVLLPEEIWLIALSNVTDPKDLQSCSNTCTLFKKLLHDRVEPTRLFQQALPHLLRYLTRSLLLKCRRISKGWNMVVEQYLEGHPSLRPHSMNMEPFDTRMLPFVNPMKELRFDRLNNFDFRREEFQSRRSRYPFFPTPRGSNPLMGRAVTLVIGLGDLDQYPDSDDDITSDDDYEYWQMKMKMERSKKFWKSIRSFLQAFGEHIWYLTLDSQHGRLGGECGDENMDYATQMLKIITVDIPALVPNLRKLCIIPCFEEYYYRQLPGNLEESFPTATKLETIQADGQNVDCGHPILGLIRRHHSTLRSLHLPGRILTTVLDWKLEWPNLVELHLDHMMSEASFRMLVEAGGGMGMMPLLTKLGVNLRERQRSLDWLLDIVHHDFQLTTLQLRGGLQVDGMFQQIRWKSCMSPTMKTLEVEHGEEDDGKEFYAFLIHFPLVENIHLFIDSVSLYPTPPPPRNPRFRPYFNHGGVAGVEDDVREANKLVKVDLGKYIGDGKIYQSNIWELLPRLKLLTVKWDVYTRSRYEEFKEKREEND